DVARWKSKAEEAKAAWSDASAVLEETRAKANIVHNKRTQVGIRADAAQWKSAENILMGRSASLQSRILLQNLLALTLLNTPGRSDPETGRAVEIVLPRVSELSTASQRLAAQAEKEETALRGDEMRLEIEEQARVEETARL